MNSIYTKSELTVKKYSVGMAIERAKSRLKGTPMCMNDVPSDKSQLLTLAELNDLIDQIVDNSNYYDNSEY